MEKDCRECLDQITESFKRCQGLLTAIGDETRQLIVMALLQSDLSGIRVGEIAAKTHLTRPSVSHHLKILKEAGIITMRKQGTMNFYAIREDGTQWANLAMLVQQIQESVTVKGDSQK